MAGLTELPSNRPVPVDDGACDHLLGVQLPGIPLESTRGRAVDLSSLQDTVVLYCYPMTGQPDVPQPDDWDQIPGARGCTAQACSFRDLYEELSALGASVFGLSTQSSEYQRAVAERLHLPFELLSDHQLQLTDALKLPAFTVADRRLLKRTTLIAEADLVVKVFYPVFPPDKHAEVVVAWLRDGGSRSHA